MFYLSLFFMFEVDGVFVYHVLLHFLLCLRCFCCSCFSFLWLFVDQLSSCFSLIVIGSFDFIFHVLLSL